ncbi:MAG: DUF3307 domain-containing protein [Thermotogota bacterium]
MIEKIFFYFFLSHLIGDYVFQTSYIARYKVSKIPILFLHSFIIFLSMLVVLLPSSLDLYNLFLLVILTIIHLFIDTLKFKNRKKEMFNTDTYYVIDQVMHLSSLMIVSLFYNNTDFFIDFNYAKLIAIGLFNAYFIGLFFYVFSKPTKPYKRDYLGYIFRFSLPFIKFYSNSMFLIISIVFIIFSLFLVNKEKKMVRSELGPLALSIIVTYLSIWR